MKNNTVIGFLGTKLDAYSGPERWEKWRPTVSLCQQDDFIVDQYELLYEPAYEEAAQLVMSDIQQISPETEIIGHCLGITQPWDFEDVFSHLHDFFNTSKFDLDTNNYFVNITTGTHVAQICMFLLAESRHMPGALIQTSPSRKRAGDNIGTYSIIDLDLSKYDRLTTRFIEEKHQSEHFLKSGIATKNKAFNELITEIEIVAQRSSAPILITGPTGAGKSQLASNIFKLKAQRNNISGSFVEINCATLKGDMAMSTLFGHKKGSFTGAQIDRTGLLREAHQGMLFLDEIGELGIDEQAMLLRAIEEGKWLPVGSDCPVKSNFQLIAGTNRDLRQAVHNGTFREDLLARINTWTFDLPGLAQRREDIAPNIQHELSKHKATSGLSVTFNKEAYNCFLEFSQSNKTPWRGNFRDLNSAITRMATLAPRGRIREQEVQQEIKRLNTSWEINDSTDQTLSNYLSKQKIDLIDPFDRPQLSYVIQVCNESNNLSEAGRKLFSISREQRQSTNDGDRLRKYLAKFNLNYKSIT